jgi:hypothetical protein
MRKHPLATAFMIAGFIVVTRGASASSNDEKNNFRPDVFACEDAVSQLASCCPGFDASQVRCEHLDYQDAGCDIYTTYRESPTFDENESACIVAMDCASLVAQHVCERAAAAKAPQSSSSYESGSQKGGSSQDKGAPVCP